MKITGIKARFSKWLPRTLLGRSLLGVGVGLLVLLFVAGFVVFSVWIEDKFPSDDPKRSLIPGLQKILTKPIVNAVSHGVERYVRSRIESRYMDTGLSLEETITRFLDERIDIEQRRIYAYRLARAGTPEAMAALFKVFQTAGPEHKVFMLQLIGSTGNPAVKDWLWQWLSDSDIRVVMATIRGLSTIGGTDVTEKLVALLRDSKQPDQLRIEAALGLGTIGTPEAADMLTKALLETMETEVGMQILDALGRFPFETVAGTFKQFLSAPEVPAEKRVVALEALAYSTAGAVPFLLGFAEGDADADVRASAAWAISTHGRYRDIAPMLTDMVEAEPDEDVRRRLYEALLPQSEIPAERLLPSVLEEDDIAARVAGFNVLASAATQGSSETFAATFDLQIVPELLQIALSDNSVNIRMRAVFALRRGQTAAAQAALAEVANNSSNPQIAEAARHGLKKRD
jgi:HEAT repeat protein